MASTKLASSSAERHVEVKAFDDTQCGVKGLVDAGIKQLPRIFKHDSLVNNAEPTVLSSINNNVAIPVIDFQGIHEDPHARAATMKIVHDACSEWGFFQVIPVLLLERAIDAIRQFHEQDNNAKKLFYSRDQTKMHCTIPTSISTSLPQLTGETLSTAIWHRSLHPLTIFLPFAGHYYPECPEPESTFGFSKHTYNSFLMVLLQDQSGGLQALYRGQWGDVKPIPGSLILNVGDMCQLITNDKYKSVYRRVVPKSSGPAGISIPCFFRSHHLMEGSDRVYEPIKELVTEENPAIYKGTSVYDYVLQLHRA